MAKTQVQNYVFKPGLGLTDNEYPNAYDLLTRNKAFIQKETTAWIALQVTQGASGFVGYTYNSAKCERDIGFNIDALAKCLRYGGNEPLYDVVKYYWDGDTPQVDGDRQPEVKSYQFIQSLITDFIFTNTAYARVNTDEQQVIDTTKTSESAASTEIDTLTNQIIAVIQNGLDSFGTKTPSGVGSVKIMGKYDANEFLLITNSTKNEIIFNFSSISTGGTVTQKTDAFKYVDEDFPKFIQKTDTVTKIELNYNTSDHSATDSLQIFVEQTENGKSQVITRPYDFGSDAIERMRVAQPLSMLDADFEYGLQPTKWAAISTLRGYPSVYELAGTDTPVQSVVTDASAGTSGVGASLITVTTVVAHGFEVGQAITIKALENSVAGAARAEGSFVITTVPTTTTFTYYAKSKVGATNGEVLSTTYTQLREADFYTGATISNLAEFSIASDGYSGTFNAELQNPTGVTLITFDGASPGIGAPLVGQGIADGTQVTAVTDISQGGGTYISAKVLGDYTSGDNRIQVEDATGIVTNLGLDRGDGRATFVQSVDMDPITGDFINLSSSVEGSIIGNTTTYSSVGGENDTGVGLYARFTVSRAGGNYTVDTITRAGEQYQVGDRIKITGDRLGGVTPDHDLIIIVDETFSDGGILNVSVEGTAYDGEGTFNDLAPSVNGGTGFGATYDVDYTNNVYTVTRTSGGEGYIANDVLLISGGILGGTGANDLKITVTSVDGSGAITAQTTTGTAPDGVESYVDPTQQYTGSGVDATFTITRTGTVYTATIDSDGSGYVATETILIDGAELGGVTSTNDCTITIDNVGGSGEITAISVSGTAVNTGSADALTPSNLIGEGAEFSLTSSAGSYSVSLVTGGTNYAANQTFTILGSQLTGESPDNDATITISTVDSGGVIQTVTVSGTANGDTDTYTDLGNTQNVAPEGINALFNVLRDTDGSSPFYDVSIASPGSGYAVGNRLTIGGDDLGGTTPLNDLEIRVTGVDGSGAITSFAESYIEAVYGDILNLYCTVSLSEATDDITEPSDVISYSALASIQIEFPNAHGLVPGDTFIVATTSDDGTNNHNLADGSFFATEVTATNRLVYQARAAGSITTTDPILGVVYPRPDSFFIHRPFDGGVQLGTGGPQHGAQAIRQSKKYIRYQSGKGIMYTTGALFAPSYDLRSVTAEDTAIGSLITVVTDDNDHGCQVGGTIRLLGVETSGYNSGPETAVPPQFDYEVVEIVDERTLKIRAQRTLGATNAVLGFDAQMSVVAWHGATVRSGIFDDQNGIFWEYDGTQLSVAQRTSTKQISGTVALTVDVNLVTGTNTRFREQLKAGDKVVIRGMTHVVSHVIDDTNLTVTPDWRGVVNISGAKMMLVTDKKVEQKDFNMDSLDGTGPSGYNFDYAKMQMIGIQYSWYGAGFIDFMVRGADGNFIFAHRMRNSNVNTEAFMRSGNLPVRYEVTNEGPPGKLAAAMDISQTTAVLEDTSFFPDSGTIFIDNEIIDFTGNDQSTNTLTGLTRSATFSNFQAGANRTYTAGAAAAHDARTGVVLISNTVTPLISHWGSAFITDGMFDEDRGYIFSYSETGLSVSTERQTAFLIRLAPSVSNAIVGDLGERELLNRAQLLLQGIEITSEAGADTKGIVIEGILNPQNYPLNPDDVGWSSLSGVAQGGQPSFAQIASGGSVVWSTGEAATTASATSIGALTATLDTGLYQSRDRTLYVNAGDYRNTFGDNSLSYVNGKTVSGSNIQSNTTVTGGYISPTSDYGYFRLSQNLSGRINGGQSNYITVTFNEALQNRSFAYLTESSFSGTGAKVGTAVTTSGGSVNFPSQTYVNNIELQSWAGTNYYRVDFNQSFSGTLALSSGTIEFEFVQPPYAQPGETIFGFIATPGERATQDFKELKELTNTPLGGRGTYPNGPDVLAVNVYKVGGAAVEANIVLKWGEAQA